MMRLLHTRHAALCWGHLPPRPHRAGTFSAMCTFKLSELRFRMALQTTHALICPADRKMPYHCSVAPHSPGQVVVTELKLAVAVPELAQLRFEDLAAVPAEAAAPNVAAATVAVGIIC